MRNKGGQEGGNWNILASERGDRCSFVVSYCNFAAILENTQQYQTPWIKGLLRKKYCGSGTIIIVDNPN